MKNTICYVDIETSGLFCETEDKKNAEIIKISALKVVDKATVYSFETFVKPKRKLDKEIQELTGINNEDLLHAPDVGVALKMFKDFVGDCKIAFYNAPFDKKFLDYYGKTCGISLDNDYLDLFEMASEKLKGEIAVFKINSVCRLLEIPTDLSYVEKMRRIAERLL